ncbi:MAG: transcriptional regulator [Gemmatimonadaceae bacterium]
MSARPKPKAQNAAQENEQSVAAPSRPAKLKSVAGGKADAPHSVDSILDFDKVIHERARLAIVSALATSPSRTHNELRDVLQLTDGNLSVHARKLEEAGYISCDKDFAGRTPRTTYKLTAPGRAAFEQYLGHMEALIQAMKGV